MIDQGVYGLIAVLFDNLVAVPLDHLVSLIDQLIDNKAHTQTLKLWTNEN